MADPLDPQPDGAANSEPRAPPLADVHQLPCLPNIEEMSAFAEMLYGDAMHGLMELAWSTPEPGTASGQKLDNAAMFESGDEGMAEMLAFAARKNAERNVNSYVAPGVRDQSVAHAHAHRGEEHVIGLFTLWADCDEPGVFDSALVFAAKHGFAPTMALITCETPHRRGSLWWKLDELAGRDEFARIKTILKRFMPLLGADGLPTNPASLMRLGGSVAWPVKRGRKLEMTCIYREGERRIAPYGLDEIDRLTETALKALDASASTPGSVQEPLLDFSRARPQTDVSGLLGAIGRSGTFHENARPAVMSMIARGTPPEVVWEVGRYAVEQAGVNVEQRLKQLRDLIDGAARKAPSAPQTPEWEQREQAKREARVESERGAVRKAADAIPVIALADCGNGPDPEWIYEGLLQAGAGKVNTVYGESGVGKSFLAIHLAMHLAYGLPWCGHAITHPRRVAYVAAEDGDGVEMRMAIARDAMVGSGVVPDGRAPLSIIGRQIILTDPKTREALIARLMDLPNGPPEIVIFDTLAMVAGSTKENDSDGAGGMGGLINIMVEIGERVGACILVVHHTGKNEALGPRGSSALPAVDYMRLYLEKEGSTHITVLAEKLRNGDIIGKCWRFEKKLTFGVNPTTGKERSSLVLVWDGEPMAIRERDRQDAGGGMGARQQLIVKALEDGAASEAELINRIHDIQRAHGVSEHKLMSRRNLPNSLTPLLQRKLVRRERGVYYLTMEGRDADNEDLLA